MALNFQKGGGAYVYKSKIQRKGGAVLTAYEVVQIIFAFGQVAIALIGLCYKIFKNNDKNK